MSVVSVSVIADILNYPFILVLTKENYANPTNYGIIKFRTHKWNYNDYQHYLESMLSIDSYLSFTHGDSLPKWDDANLC